MKTKHLYLVPVLLVTLLFTQSCKDDDDIAPTPKEITFGDKTFSLEDANIYMMRDRENTTYNYRDYMISDGTYKDDGSSGWDLEDYDNATYFLVVELGVEAASEIFSIGEYPQYSNWSLPIDDGHTMWSYMYMETADGDYYDTLRETDGGDHPPIVVSGGLNNGENMILSANGTMEYEDIDGNESPVTFSFSYEGIVVDKTN